MQTLAQTLKTYQLNLNESQTKLKEIGQRVIPYTTNFSWVETPQQIKVEFKDHIGNTISVFFHITDAKYKIYEVEFNVNRHSRKAFKTNSSHFFKIISTVVEVVEQFIEKYSPFELQIEPDELVGKDAQKYNIWWEYLKVNIKDKGYILGKTPNGFTIQIKKNLPDKK
jgi:hypothetical protein